MAKSIEQTYQKLTDIEHVLLRPGRYLGSISPHTALTWVVDDGEMVKRETTWNPALLKMFDEIVSNSVDESKLNKKLDTIKIYVDVENGKITIEDNGGIPVKIHKEHNQYVPEMIFGELRAGSNFDDNEDSFGTGQNGEGASLTNIFATKFYVDTADGKKRFVQKFKNNMHDKTVPEITKDKRRYTKITYFPDLERLGLTALDGGNYEKLVKRVYDIAGCNPTLRVTLNGKLIKIKSFKDYVSLYTKDFVFDETENWKVGVAHSDDGFQTVSFVNGTETTLGGTHITYVITQIQDKIREYLKKKYKQDVRPADIRNHITLFVDASIVNPRYSSQTKEDLITEAKDYKTEYKVPDKVINKILKSDIIESVIEWIEAKKLMAERAALKKASKTKRKNVSSHRKANGKNREDCILFLTEGDSAINNFVNVRNSDIHGGFPLRGKPKNISEMKLTDILKNVELSNVMDIIGLNLGEKAEDLNYGKIAIMADADEDGKSITALMINFFALWPDLFKDKRIYILKSPIVIATKGKKSKWFYNMEKYLKYKEEEVDTTWQIKYNKGLGGLSLEEYRKMVNQPLLEEVILDKNAKKQLKTAFGKDASLRKTWLME